MLVINIIAGFILFFSFVGGCIEGAGKSLFSLIAFLIAIPIAGRFYTVFANWLSFLPGQNWENFLGFMIVLALASVVLSFVFFFPRRILELVWHEGVLFRLVGGVLNLLGAAIGLVVFALLISSNPIWDWLQQALAGSAIINWLIDNLRFVQGLLPVVMRKTV
jgi:uncharacterized membrane protein required for colicin V production